MNNDRVLMFHFQFSAIYRKKTNIARDPCLAFIPVGNVCRPLEKNGGINNFDSGGKSYDHILGIESIF